MIGKKSKFEEYVKIQNKESSNTSGSNEDRRREKEKIESRKKISDVTSDSRIRNTDNTEPDTCDGDVGEYEGSEEEIEEVPEEIQHTKEADRIFSSGSSKKNNTVSIQDIKSITIIKKENIKSDAQLLWDEVCNGVQGKNSGISMGFNRLNKYLGLRRSIYTTIGATSGCGKTSLVDCAYVLNPYDWYMQNKHKSKIKFEVIYFSMERKKMYKLAKWVCLKIWKEEGVLITTDEILSWQTILDKKKQEMARFYIFGYIDEMMQSGVITIMDGQRNPTGIYKYLYAHALQRGVEDEISEYEKRYTPNDDNLITNIVHDHAGKTKNENIGGKYDKKLSIDKASEYYCWA